MNSTLNPIAMQSSGVNSITDPLSVQKLSQIGDAKERAEAVATQFESIFMGMMIKSMRDTVPDGGLLGEGLGGKTYVEMMDQQLAQMGGLPRDPRFHEALVRQIIQDPGALQKVSAAGK
ncbi:MAG: rod-binding protein [Candidatus Sumerlaeia bacterium]